MASFRLVKLHTLLMQLIPNCTANHGITYTNTYLATIQPPHLFILVSHLHVHLLRAWDSCMGIIPLNTMLGHTVHLSSSVVSHDHLVQPFYMCVANKQNPDYANGVAGVPQVHICECHSSLGFMS